jgi:hypothetical protein
MRALRSVVVLSFVALLAACGGADSRSASITSNASAGGDALAPPTLSVDETVGVTSTSIPVAVCADGDTGAAGGFSLQWMSALELERTGEWNDLCAASFAGNKNSRFGLEPGACETVVVGAFVDEPGASWNADPACVPLACGTTYVFRAFAHNVPQGPNKSGWSPLLSAWTASCDEQGCTLTQGYWKNHEEAWPVESLQLGDTTYAQAQLLVILRTPVEGNGLLSLAHQLIAAKLNVEKNGGAPDGVVDDIDAADELIGALVVGTDSLSTEATSALASKLDAYNNGLCGPPHCE